MSGRTPRKFTDEMLAEALLTPRRDLPALAAKWGLPLGAVRKKHHRQSPDAIRVADALGLPPAAQRQGGIRFAPAPVNERSLIEAVLRGDAQ